MQRLRLWVKSLAACTLIQPACVERVALSGLPHQFDYSDTQVDWFTGRGVRLGDCGQQKKSLLAEWSSALVSIPEVYGLIPPFATFLFSRCHKCDVYR